MTSSFTPFLKRLKATPLVPEGAEITPYKVPELVEGAQKTYTQIKSTFKQELNAKDARFVLSELVANQMSVEEEEQRRFDKKVAETVEATLAGLRDEAKQNGYKAGFEAGRAEAYNEEKAKLAVHVESLAEATKTLVDAKKQLGEQYESYLVEMAFKIAKLIVQAEIEHRPEVISKTIQEILGRIAKDDDVMIRMSIHEFEAIDKISEEIKALGRSGRVSFESDAALSRGACVVESLSGEIASEIENKFTKLQAEVQKGLFVKDKTQKASGDA
jgi:flagellar biosynthesis/type III secretory pathway protein FliH